MYNENKKKEVNFQSKRCSQLESIKNSVKKIVLMAMCIFFVLPTFSMVVNAEVMPIKKFLPIGYGAYVLRANGDLIYWNDKTNYMPELVSLNVVDIIINNSGYQYIKSNGELIDQFGKIVATDAKSLNVTYGYINKNNELKSYDGYDITGVKTIATDVLYEKRGMIIKTNGELFYGDKLIMDNAKEIVDFDRNVGYWYVIDNQQQLWFISGEPKMAIKLISNVKKVVQDKMVAGYCWVITNNDELYWHSPNSSTNSEVKFHSGNIQDVRYFADRGLFLLRTNGEFCKLKLEGNPESDIVFTDNIKFFTDNYVITNDGVAKAYHSNGVFSNDSSFKWIDLGSVKNILFSSLDTVLYENANNEVYGLGSQWYLGLGNLSANGHISTPVLLPIGLKGTKVMYNGEKVKFTLRSQIRDDRTFYPLRECLDALGATVLWDNETQTATGLLSGKKVEFKIGSNEYKVNGVAKQMDTAAFVDESLGKTYIPLRYAAEGLGFKIDWKSGDHEDTITISK